MRECQQEAADLLLKEDEQKAVNVLQYSRESFPRTERLRSSGEFSSVYSGRRVTGSMFILYYKCIDDRKAGFTVSKKVSKSAVKRNRLKRRMREVYRRSKSMLPENVSIVIRALPQALGADFNEIEAEIRSLFKAVAAKEFGNTVN